ncbi:MAG: phosphoadenosine phosphosulfate reductase family protein, partial [Gammaproteobacteria bacterium]
CFFQRRDEWVGLLRRHPELFRQAQQYEKLQPEDGSRFTWSQGTTLAQIAERADEIEEKAIKMRRPKDKRTWQEILAEEGEDDESCLACSL